MHPMRMHRRLVNVWAAGAMATLLATACGSAPRETSSIAFRSPGVRADGVTKQDYRCGGSALWLPLQWGRVPAGTEELAIYIGRFKYERRGATRRLVVPFAYLIYGIEPSLRHLPANTTPRGTTWTFFGPLSCPPVRRGQNILQVLFALDRTRYRGELTPRLATRITEEALRDDQPTERPRSPGALTEDAAGIGRFTATYGP
jgi:hypothetical protein